MNRQCTLVDVLVSIEHFESCLTHASYVGTPNVDAECDEVRVGVGVGFAFGDPLKVSMGLAAKTKLRSHDNLSKVRHHVKDKHMKELIGP